MNQTAQGLAALGRGPDTMLVHMAPEEVAGLQALALKHGGTLTVNPETGLAEAGFLKNILPMVAGFALNAFAPGVGTAVGSMFGLGSAAGTALTVGGIAGLTSGNLEKGLMAGLGAYGGAGLAEGFANAGTGAMSSAAGAGAPQVAAESIVPQAVAPAVAAPTSAVSAANVAPNLFGGTESEIAKAYGYTAASPLEAAKTVATVTPQISPAELAAQAVREQNAAAFMNEQAQQQAVAKALANKTDLVSAGFDVAKNAPGAFLKKNMLPLGALGIAALSGSDDKNVPTPSNPGLIRPYTYARTKVPGAFDRTPNDPLSSRERQYFNDQYTAQTPYRAPGPEYMAMGGPVEDMSNGNDMAAYMGQDKFDQGGAVTGTVGGYTYNPRTGLYTKPGGQGATTVAPTGGISGASGDSGGSDPTNYVNPNVAKETFEEQSARNQKLNDFLTEVLPTVFSPFSTMARGLYDTPIAGAIANFFSPPGSQPNYGVPVDNMGTYAGMPAMGQTSYESGVGNPAEGGVAQSGHSSSFDGSTVSDTGNTPGGGGAESEARGGLNLNGKYYPPKYAQGGLSALAQGGMSNLGSYSDGGRLLRGPGDGVSDSIPAMIGQKQQARLADGEFVVPARIVSELGNGSTEAGARQLYAMMDRVQKARKKTVGKNKVATNSRAAKLLPA